MDKVEIRKTVEDEIEKTEHAIQHYKDLTQPISPSDAIGRVSRMDAINNKSINEASLRQAETKLKKLHIVLSKIEDADFGICLKCKQPIPVGRILIRPESLLCVNCAR
ncbi:TraR/DksA family transcriptional regulator [Psychroserpens sp.]|uniref:TraR/DksA family transcriptional regulator n=1 Tax=Psychroserpens sp. TaxID=2020870 RepID=UPI001B252655|nr:TraR/DksA C4-type zinc finger protein [Psychroserpens sp.]MBO6605493.1 TraR/DksA C4-type zinc finger protein [Psychroserpens sp.]MBO6630666.1 TraR/DksA C4-type zinc finger protein [Psychroserpens sp.]MBO6653698.1 TraR/DksA C4-type zinc finger protein [Psychroserpens sp.]MBO6682019.1 TraR/DksA C4-type zinc finger protein [Psychroserpens sp.]MBO6748867.1 TraR/DksA C4-type zinc finger protein [Psychroserpens sp.]